MLALCRFFGVTDLRDLEAALFREMTCLGGDSGMCWWSKRSDKLDRHAVTHLPYFRPHVLQRRLPYAHRRAAALARKPADIPPALVCGESSQHRSLRWHCRSYTKLLPEHWREVSEVRSVEQIIGITSEGKGDNATSKCSLQSV